MTVATLPRNCTIDGLVVALAGAGAFLAGGGPLLVSVPEHGFLHCSAMAFLSAWGHAQRAQGRSVLLRGDPHTLGYLVRMGLQDLAGLEHAGEVTPPPDVFAIPLRQVANPGDVQAAATAIRALVAEHCVRADAFLPAIEWAVAEVLDNVLVHSATGQPGAVCAQYFPRRRRLDVAICDVGQGIYASLSEAMPLWSHGDAVSKAVRRGVTRSTDVGQGNGLAGVKEIAERNKGNFDIWTGDVVFHAVGGIEKGFSKIPEIPGTGVMFSLDTERPVDLTSTWIAAATPGWRPSAPGDQMARSLSDLIGAPGEPPSGERAPVAGPPVAASGERRLVVGRECSSTGAREDGRTLRRNLMRLLLGGPGVVTLDFAGAETPTSSFLDELLGRLVEESGPEVVQERVRLEGMSSLAERIAAVVIRQRLGSEPAPPENGEASP